MHIITQNTCICAHAFQHSVTKGIYCFSFYSGFYSSFTVNAVFYVKFMRHLHNCCVALKYYGKILYMYTIYYIKANS